MASRNLGKPPAPPRATRLLIGLYGGGQFVASIAMFVAGGYGALRKTPAGAGSLDTVAAAGMAVHGDRFDLHHSGRRGFCDRRHPRVVADDAGSHGGVIDKPRIEPARSLWRQFASRGWAPNSRSPSGGLLERASLQLGRAKVHDREAEEGEGKRLMGERKLDRDEREQGRNAKPDLEQRDGREDNNAAYERRTRGDAERGDRLNKGEGDNRISDRPVVELRRRPIAEYRLQRVRAKRLAWNKARSHQGPGVVDEAGAEARHQRAKAELTERRARRRSAPKSRSRAAPRSIAACSLRPTAA